MTRVYNRDLTPWRGERVGGVRLPANIGTAWSGEDLAAVGLYRAYPPAEIPQGRRLSANVEWDGTGVRHVLEDIPPPPPVEVSAAQAKLALEASGLLDDVETMIEAHPVRAVRIWYANANTWVRTHPYIAALGLEMNLDDETIDNLFAAAGAY